MSPSAHTQSTHTWRVRLYGSFIFILPYVFRLHGFFVLSKLNTQAIIQDANSESVQQHRGCCAEQR